MLLLPLVQNGTPSHGAGVCPLLQLHWTARIGIQARRDEGRGDKAGNRLEVSQLRGQAGGHEGGRCGLPAPRSGVQANTPACGSRQGVTPADDKFKVLQVVQCLGDNRLFIQVTLAAGPTEARIF